MFDLYTPEGETLSATPWDVYPRPQLRRDSFLNLNGEWEFSMGDEPRFDRTILVPFPPESLLSGIHEHAPEGCPLYYRRRFTLPHGFQNERVLLHLGACDQRAEVFVNDIPVGRSSSGYHAATFDITDALAEENCLVVRAVDDLRSCAQPYGKQTRKRGGMWYTPVSGIWQTVWLESVPTEHIRTITLKTGADHALIDIEDALDGIVAVQTPDGTLRVPLMGGKARVSLSTPRLWSPEDPYLYEFTIETAHDRVASYFALRTLETKVIRGVPRLCLNGKPYFFHGLLDQGYWSDGLFTPADPSCFTRDILAMKKLGFNTLRKHIKVEPDLFYCACDRLGIVVFQDMVNNGRYSFLRDTALPTLGLLRRNDRRLHRDSASRAAFLTEMEATVRQLRNHPSVCYWTIFNEGWGQFDSSAVYERLRALDDSRWIDSHSGWFLGGKSDVDSRHVYFRRVNLRHGKLPLVLSEFGGYSYKPEGHFFNPNKTYGYRQFHDAASYAAAVETLYREQIVPAVRDGLCAAIYTQLSDVEDETNGLLSYDRRVEKLEAARMLPVARRLQDALTAQTQDF